MNYLRTYCFFLAWVAMEEICRGFDGNLGDILSDFDDNVQFPEKWIFKALWKILKEINKLLCKMAWNDRKFNSSRDCMRSNHWEVNIWSLANRYRRQMMLSLGAYALYFAGKIWIYSVISTFFVNACFELSKTFTLELKSVDDDVLC